MHRETQTQKREKELKNPPEEDPEFQIAPMIDILLVLLVFFMSISSTEVLQSNRDIQLPVAADGKTLRAAVLGGEGEQAARREDARRGGENRREVADIDKDIGGGDEIGA